MMDTGFNINLIAASVPVHTIISTVFLLTVAIYALFTFFMYYHWKEYSIDPKVSRVTGIAYAVCTLPLMFIIGVMTLII